MALLAQAVHVGPDRVEARLGRLQGERRGGHALPGGHGGALELGERGAPLDQLLRPHGALRLQGGALGVELRDLGLRVPRARPVSSAVAAAARASALPRRLEPGADLRLLDLPVDAPLARRLLLVLELGEARRGRG